MSNFGPRLCPPAFPSLKAAKRHWDRAWLSYDTLYVNGVPVSKETTRQTGTESRPADEIK
ncbi:hypothetical protein MAR_015918 [Mya arenaria]|uniref:Uncharacterized protein n=1 Tax=Mya arenaria TaxID=6604 RepID=A0ABY7FKT0_MYAAR|nr:hypothetical protein MAR_015918 [Mya arenaria]